MKKITKALALLLAAVMLMPIVPTAHAADILGDKAYKEVARIHATSGCAIMQGMGVGEKYAYTAQISGNDSLAQVKQIDLETGTVTTMTDGQTGATIFNYLSHANDMDVAEVNGMDWLFIAASDKIYVFEVDNENAVLHQRAVYSTFYNGSAFAPVGISIYEINEREITFLFKGGYAISKGSIPIDATTGNIAVTIQCMINVKKVPINGQEMDLSHYLNQGFDYRDGVVYAVFAGCSRAETIHHSMIVGFDITRGKGTMYPQEDKIFYIESARFRILFEMQSCGFTPDGRLFFNINGSYDGVFVLNDFVYSPEEEDPSPTTYTVRFDGAGAEGEMEDITVPCGQIVSFPQHTYLANDRRLNGWTATRASDNTVYCVKKKDLSEAAWLTPDEIDKTYIPYVFSDGGFVMDMSEVDGDVITLTADWELFGDINQDGVLNITDVIALRLISEACYPSDLALLNIMDVNDDGAVNASDAWTLFVYLGGAIEKLPACE